jgi:hypothetical protein
MSLRQSLSSYWERIQGELFPFLEAAIGPLTAAHRSVVMVLEMAEVDAHVPHLSGTPGRPRTDRAALCRAFIAKAVFDFPTTRMLIDRLIADPVLRRLCGWSRIGEVPHESCFSRAFGEFAHSGLPSCLHEMLIAQTHKDRLVGHISRDATAIHGRERPKKVKARTGVTRPARKRGRPKKEEIVPEKVPRRIVQQASGMTMAAMLADLPNACDTGIKRNAKGYQQRWIGYKLHIDTADGDIPIS